MNENELSEFLAKQFSQPYIVIGCLVRALAKQPGFDSERFLRELTDESDKIGAVHVSAREVLNDIVDSTRSSPIP